MKDGWAQTVLGPVDATDLGITLAHDHVLMDGSFMYVDPPTSADQHLADEQITLDNRAVSYTHLTLPTILLV